MKRINSIDVARGIVMIIMALDHTRDLIHVSSLTQQPTNLNTTTPALFFTRWITYLCAPTFVFLSGVSAYISFKNKNNYSQTRQYLLSRGILLIILDLTIINFGVWFDVHFSVILIDVLSAIGTGFIVLSFLLRCSAKTIAVAGLAIIFLHNLFPLIPFAEASLLKNILTPFFTVEAISPGNDMTIVVGYPPVPWIGIMLAGFAAGVLFTLALEKRRNIFLKIGILSIVLFAILRFINLYGDLVPWQVQKTPLFTFLSFINVTKYPPSLQFCLLTLGIMFLMLYAAESMSNKFTEITIVFGKVPLFYFIVHWYIIHPVMFFIVFLQGYKPSDLLFGFNFGRPKEASGVGLLAVYLIWIGVVLVMYPLCRWYGQYKLNHKEIKWLRFI
ncbi:MAG: heparan-alpha-glucosaminide N-acetyltransferase domain-containing protein [Ferruginibacter sp.]